MVDESSDEDVMIEDPTPVKRKKISKDAAVNSGAAKVLYDVEESWWKELAAVSRVEKVVEIAPVPVESAKKNMIEHIRMQAIRSAMSYNASQKKTRKAYKSIFTLDNKKRAIDRENLSRMKNGFLKCNYAPSQAFINIFLSHQG